MSTKTELNPVMKEKYEQMLADALAPGSGCSAGYIAHLQAILDGQKPLFLNHQYLSETILHRDEKQKRQQKNEDRLNQCDFHNFDQTINLYTFDSFIFQKRWKCMFCGGVVTDEQKKWYEAGLAHRQGLNKRGDMQ